MQPPQHEQELSASPPAQALDYDHPRFHKGGNRAVIPSKRAAQNRAAQKAFRQRREQYIKDLEIKAKEMEDWQNELDRLRKENGDLRDRVSTLEHQVTVLTGGDPSKIPPEPIRKPPPTVDIVTNDPEPEPAVDKTQQHQQQQQQQHPGVPSDYWGNNNMQVGDFDLDFDFDPFFEDEFGPTLTSNNDFLPNANSGQVLDDLFAMLQTRQRPQIPIVPGDDNSDFPNNNNNSNNLL
ncbi:uncharacterized protein EV154DRAFT_418857 [Mucor mucedo]|uniref:uncharacterized protein n=1 Tax=Mucor mucedo TaxID=29922 RepID=UPI002220A4C7|nr:uncharacterized protein EV154DRAFT_418857 [Mucor mucedo]KAI7892242.1 hypothetical protein EV154DRAFT_418857 [Mucor mucedo]